jgi:hypothetical protein
MSYTSEQIFERADVNSFIDQLYYYLDEYFKANAIVFEFPTEFALSGRAASDLQSEPIAGGNQNVIFVTLSEDVFKAFYLEVQNKLPNQGFIIFKEIILIYYNQIYFEIWLVDSLTTIEVSTIFVQSVRTIPSQFL